MFRIPFALSAILLLQSTALLVLLILVLNVPKSNSLSYDATFTVLKDLYDSTEGNTWTRSQNWVQAKITYCDWYGVYCKYEFNGADPTVPKDLNVTGLVLRRNGLIGSLPESFASLDHLLYLDLRDNNLLALPIAFGDLTSLRWMYLSNNLLSGTLPAEWGNMSNLMDLYLGFNLFCGTLPDAWKKMLNLEFLSLPSNDLNGTLPSKWASLTKLRTLTLYHNDLDGTLPEEWASMTNIQILSLHSNDLSGTLPEEWASMTNLQSLSLSLNDLNGTLPEAWANMTSLEELNLHSTRVHGTLPEEWASMTNIQILSLYSNDLSGTLPEGWANMTNLQTLSLSSNDLNGTLPGAWANMTSLEELHLHSTRVHGTLPEEWKNMANLSGLNLYSNHLNGALPEAWANMPKLQVLLLHWNDLSGTLPKAWEKMTTLQALLLNSNHLDGTLPEEWASMTNLQRLHLESNQLSGTLPEEWASLTNLQRLYLESNQLSGTLPEAWEKMTTLQALLLNSNHLDGTLPEEWASMTNLQRLYLESNQLSGTLPSKWASMTKLQTFTLYYNDLDGTLPEEWASMTNIQILSLHSNDLSGTLPEEWKNMANLQLLSLSSNDLNGTLPEEWTYMRSLEYLGLMLNHFSGTLPEAWASMANLEELHLHSNHLNGTLPSKWASLTKLRKFTLYFSDLDGTLPEEWASMTNLEELHLHSNHLNGTLPSKWASLTKLRKFTLYSNDLSGTLPEAWGNMSGLLELFLHSNDLSGTLPEAWASMTNLHMFLLYSNHLNGTLPEAWANMSGLTHLYLDANDLSGTLPEVWASMANLRSLFLYSNHLNGTLPEAWGNMNELFELCLHLNDLSGTLPEGWASAKKIEIIYLDRNCLEGSIPAKWGNMSKLKRLKMYSNRLSGTLPEEVGRMMESLRLDHNNLEGTLPVSWGMLSMAEAIWLNHNNLTGTLPPEWGEMKQLRNCFLENNQLHGTLPEAWGALRIINSMDLSFNQFNGSFPKSWFDGAAGRESVWVYAMGNMISAVSEQTGWLTKLNLGQNRIVELPKSLSPNLRALNLRFNRISGTIPKAYGLVNATNLQTLLLDGNNISGTLPNEIAQLIDLEELSLSDNKIDGLPKVWPPKLRGFFVARNALAGTLPRSLLQSHTFNLCNADFSGNMMSQELNTSNLLPWLRLGVLDISKNNWSGESLSPLTAEEKRNYQYTISSPVNCSRGTYFNLLPRNPTFLGLGPDLVEDLQLTGFRTPWQFLDPNRSVKIVPETRFFDPSSYNLSATDVPCSVVCRPTRASFVSAVREESGYIASIRLQLVIDDMYFVQSTYELCDCPFTGAETLVSPNFRAIAAFYLEPADPAADLWSGEVVSMGPSPSAIFFFASLRFGVSYTLRASILIRLSKSKEGYEDTVTLEAVSNVFHRILCPSTTDAAVENTTYCLPCPSLAICNGTTVILSPGGWRPSSKELSFTSCTATGCSSGRDRQGWECERGYEGVLCQSCQTDYARNGLFCVECLGKTLVIVVSTCILVLIVLYLTFFVVLDMRIEESEEKVSKSSHGGSKFSTTTAGMIFEAIRTEGAEIQPEVLNLAKMLGNHLSIMSYVMQERLATVNLGLSSVVSFSKQVLMPTETYAFFAQLQCLTAFDAIDELFASGPILIGLFFVVFFLVTALSFIPIMKLESPIKKFSAMVCVVLILLGKWVLSGAARIYSCDTIKFDTFDSEGTTVETLAADRSISCSDGSTRFLAARILAAFLAFFCVACIPAITLLLFIRHRKLFGEKRALQHFRFMTANFLPSSWFWELVLLMREYLCELVSFGLSGNLMQLVALRFILFGALILQWLRKPYLNKGYNTIDVLSMLCALLLIDLLTITSTLDDSESQLQTVMVIACSSTIVIGILPFPVRLVRQIRKNRSVRRKRMTELMLLGSELEQMECLLVVDPGKEMSTLHDQTSEEHTKEGEDEKPVPPIPKSEEPAAKPPSPSISASPANTNVSQRIDDL